jgi:hypothetical protein
MKKCFFARRVNHRKWPVPLIEGSSYTSAVNGEHEKCIILAEDKAKTATEKLIDCQQKLYENNHLVRVP